MTTEKMNKYAYDLMVKNNPDEASKNLFLKDKEIDELEIKLFKIRKLVFNLLDSDHSERNMSMCIGRIYEILKEGVNND